MKRVLAPAAIRLERTEIELRVVFTNEKPFFFFFFSFSSRVAIMKFFYPVFIIYMPFRFENFLRNKTLKID